MQQAKKLSGLLQDEPHERVVLQETQGATPFLTHSKKASGTQLAPIHTSHHSKDFPSPADSRHLQVTLS